MTELIKIDKAMVESFEINLLDVQKMVDEYQKLALKSDDKESYKVCRTALTVCVRNRTSIDKRRKGLNTEDQDRIKKRNGVAKQLTDLISPAETHLFKLVKGEDSRIEEIKAEIARKEQARVDEIQERISWITSLTASLHMQPNVEELEEILRRLEVMEITPDIFMEFTALANESKHEVRLTLLKALDARKEFEAQEQALRAQNEEIEKQKAELEARAKEQEQKQAEIDREEQDLLQKKSLQEAHEQRVKLEKEAKEKAEKEAKEKLEKVLSEEKIKKYIAEKEKEEQEQREKVEKERQEALLPDTEKLNYWIDETEIAFSKTLLLKNSNAIDAQRSIKAKGDGFIKYARERINEL